jgi:hypothetical protein
MGRQVFLLLSNREIRAEVPGGYARGVVDGAGMVRFRGGFVVRSLEGWILGNPDHGVFACPTDNGTGPTSRLISNMHQMYRTDPRP